MAIEAPGFKTYRQTNLVVIAGGTTHADEVLEFGAVAESVNVVGAVAQLQTATAGVVAQVSTQMIDQVPLVVGGATVDGITILTGRFNSVEAASVNMPSIDAIQAFTVESSVP